MNPRLKTLGAFAALVTALVWTACGPPERGGVESQLSDAEARAIIDEMNSAWDTAVLAGDFETLVAMYTEDAIRMQPDLPALVGRDAIRNWMQGETNTYSFEGSNEILEVRALSPDWIMLRSSGSFTATPRAGGEPSLMQEKWLTLVQRQPDGSWRWYRGAGSSDLPR